MEVEIIFPGKGVPYHRTKKSIQASVQKAQQNKPSIEQEGEMEKISDSEDISFDILELNGIMPSSSQMSFLPENAEQFTSDLTELEIINNNIQELPQLLRLLKWKCRSLQKLLIYNNALQSLPDEVGILRDIQVLNLSRNQLKKLPDSLSDLKNLESLDLSHNELVNLPVSYAKLQRLKRLDISNNKFTAIPKCMSNGMGTLTSFDISENPQARLNIAPYSKYLESFYARNNKHCSKFPDWMLTPKFFNLKEINLNGTSFDVYSFILKEGLFTLKTLSMTCSNLSSPVLKMMIENMISLEKIDVGNENTYTPGNIFSSIHVHELKNPELITEINFRGTSLATLPVDIDKLCNLKKADLGMNSLTWLPEEFCKLHKLEILKIDENGLIVLPKNIGNLKSIREIRAANNNLEKLPESIQYLKYLTFLDLYNNILDKFPDTLLKMDSLQGLDICMNYFSTDDIKIREISYSVFKNEYAQIDTTVQNRCLGVKIKESIDEDAHESCSCEPRCSISYSSEYSSSSSEEESNKTDTECEPKNVEECWDEFVDSADEYEPEDLETVYTTYTRKASYTIGPLGFCPADMHSRTIKRDVVSLRQYGSFPSHATEPGQFDDA